MDDGSGAEQEIFFTVETPLGFTVRVTRRYWELIVTIKHPVMAGREEEVKATLQNPFQIRLSRNDSKVVTTQPKWVN